MNFTKYLMIFAFAMVIVACGQSETSTPDDNSANVAQENAQERAEVAADKADSAMEELKSFITSKARLEWKAAYDFTTTGKDIPANQEKMTMTQYFKGENKVRFDVTSEGVESRTYLLKDEFVTCTKDKEWQCFTLTSKDSVPDTGEKYEDDIVSGDAGYDIKSDGTRTIAGVTAMCFKVLSTTESANVNYCFSKEGIPLYMKMQAEGVTTEMMATSVSKSVSDSDFVPPVKPQDLGAMMGSAGGAGGDPCAMCNYLSGDDKTSCLENC